MVNITVFAFTFFKCSDKICSKWKQSQPGLMKTFDIKLKSWTVKYVVMFVYKKHVKKNKEKKIKYMYEIKSIG